MPKSIYNDDLEQGRYGRTVLSGTSRISPPGGYVFGGIQCTTAGAINQSTSDYAAALWVGNDSAAGSLVAGEWYPGRRTSVIGDGTLAGFLYHEPI